MEGRTLTKADRMLMLRRLPKAAVCSAEVFRTSPRRLKGRLARLLKPHGRGSVATVPAKTLLALVHNLDTACEERDIRDRLYRASMRTVLSGEKVIVGRERELRHCRTLISLHESRAASRDKMLALYELGIDRGDLGWLRAVVAERRKAAVRVERRKREGKRT